MQKRKYHNGKEQFVLQGQRQDFCVSDFWAFSFGDLLDNTRRGALAEFIVAKALRLDTKTPRRDWSEYDLDYKGVRVEVKSASYIQSWNVGNEKFSELRFSIRPARVFEEESSRYIGEKARHSDIYVFCVYAEKDKETYDILDLSKWEFYVVQTSVLEKFLLSQKSVSLKVLINTCKALKTDFLTLKECIDEIITK